MMHVYDDDISLFAKIPVYEYLVKSHLSTLNNSNNNWRNISKFSVEKRTNI